MSSSTLVGLFENITVLLALLFIYDAVAHAGWFLRARFRPIISGALIGLIGLFVILTPWATFSGMILDTRSILLGISGLFFGQIPTFIAMGLMMGVRVIEGGSGTGIGILNILIAGSFGMVWRRRCRHPLEKTTWKEFYLFGLACHLAILACALLLPWEQSQLLLDLAALPMLGVYPLGTVLIGMLLAGRLRHVQAEESLRQSHADAHAILNAVSESVFLMALDGTVIATNEITAQRLGKSAADLVGKNIYDLLPSEVIAFRKKEVDRVASEGEPCHFEDRRLDHWIENSLYPIFDADGRVTRLAIFGRDITERKSAEEEIQAAHTELKRLLADTEHSRMVLLSLTEDQKAAEEQVRQLNRELEQRVRERTAQLTAANQELESFSYSVSHDLRAPLRALDGYCAALQEDCAGQLDDQGRHYLARIQESAHHMGQLINDLLNLSRIARTEFSRQPVDLSRLAEAIAAELQARSPERQVSFEIAAGMVVEGDPNLIKIAMENLLNNAFKFTSQRKPAEIRVGYIEQNGRRVYFVRDNGAGFDMEYANKLFAPFQRLHSGQEFPGTGIGLSIVQRIIARHGGRIWPESQVDRGATFYFTLNL